MNKPGEAQASSVETLVPTAKDFELFLLNLRYKEGTLVTVEGNKPVALDRPDSVWIVYTGAVDVFAVPTQDGRVAGQRRYLFHGRVGQSLFGVQTAQTGHGAGLIAGGTPGTTLLKVDRSRLWQLSNEWEYSELANMLVSDWVAAFAAASIAGAVVPKEAALLDAGTTIELDADQAGVSRKGVVWARCREGSIQLIDRPELSWSAADGFVPVTRTTWIRPNGTARVETVDTAALTQQDVDWSALERFHRVALLSIVDKQAREESVEAQRLQEKSAAERRVMAKTLQQLLTPFAGDDPAALDEGRENDAVLAACRVVGRHMGIDITSGRRGGPARTPEHALRTIVKASRVRMRDVRLRETWWRDDNGPLLAFRERDHRPLALLPVSHRRYTCYDPIERTRVPVDARLAAELSPLAYTFYRPLPNGLLGGRDVLKWGLAGSKRELRAVFLVGFGTSLLTLIPPIMTGVLFNTIIPQGRQDALLQVGVALLLIALTVGIFQIVRGIALLRLQSKLDASLQAAIWDRLLSLPTPFFRGYSSGELGNRAMGITEMRRVLSGHILTTVFNGMFAVSNLVLLFVYSPLLAAVVLGIVLVSLLVTALAGLVYVRYQRKLQHSRGKVAGTVLQLLTGLTKFRLAGAEHHAFALWSRGFIDLKRIDYRSRTVTNNLVTFNAAYPIVASLVVFAVLSRGGGVAMSTGDFLAFNLAFVQFLVAYSLLGSVLVYVLSTIPTFERMLPILQTPPEVDETKLDPGELIGDIEVSHVSFRYREAAPLVLKDVSIRVRPGEFVALVGASGSGKSTLLRLLLGFAVPEAGGVYYDDQDLSDLDLQTVRRQIGVVLQNATLMPGDVYSNIIGSSPTLTLDDAWEAAKMAGLDRDLKHMPMGLHTIVAERGSNFSGGQRQRLLIARAMVNRPRILLFDEATSALDNQTQQVVSESLEGLHASRIVIAHRLSTVINADRIYVMEGGRVVQEGTYDQLINAPGAFAALAKRQMT